MHPIFEDSRDKTLDHVLFLSMMKRNPRLELRLGQRVKYPLILHLFLEYLEISISNSSNTLFFSFKKVLLLINCFYPQRRLGFHRSGLHYFCAFTVISGFHWTGVFISCYDSTFYLWHHFVFHYTNHALLSFSFFFNFFIF